MINNRFPTNTLVIDLKFKKEKKYILARILPAVSYPIWILNSNTSQSYGHCWQQKTTKNNGGSDNLFGINKSNSNKL